ncbi:hypothetical protein NPIL_209411 [Nephila pilipes]|uniref:Uncharacterized protein n=1 Tax=Nephila pilipes TaxID=299642 RepID=A0A8X6U2R0_NEPPI|nr:hypothetical protein NPIL_209411 [Nephila pilipes]
MFICLFIFGGITHTIILGTISDTGEKNPSSLVRCHGPPRLSCLGILISGTDQSDATSAFLLPIKADSATSRVILLRSLTHNMKDEETFGSVVFNYRRPNLTEFMDFFVQFRQQLNSLEPSDIVPILSFRQSILVQVAQLVPHCDELDVPYFHGLVFLELGEIEDDDMQAAAERGHGAVLQAIWTEYGKPKLYLLARTAWDT